MFIDSHCHLNFPELACQIDTIRADMDRAQVTHALLISTTLETFGEVHAMAQRYDNFWATVGVHPDHEGVLEPSVATLIEHAQHERVVGIGETGLDYYRLEGRSIAEMEWQRARFRTHIEAAQAVQKPLIIHTRSAQDDTLSLLKEATAASAAQAPISGVFHCFTESIDVARRALDMGFYISFSGILTFKNALDLREVAAFVPLSRCLIETDSPYLAPAPHRGKLNSPALVPFVAQALAQAKGCSIEEVAKATSRNFFDLFKTAKR